MRNVKSFLAEMVIVLVLGALAAACGGGGGDAVPAASGGTGGTGGSGGSGSGTGTYKVGGTVSGLVAGKSVTLLNNGGDALSVAANGAFAFATALADGAAYDVTVGAQPPATVCTVSGGKGTVGGADVSGVRVVCRSSGFVDAGFGVNGAVEVNDPLGGISPPDEYGYDVAVDRQGRVLVAGSLFNGNDNDMALWRFNADGSPDTSFGTKGLVTDHNAAGGNYHDYGRAVAVGKNGNIYVAGYSYGNNGNNDMVVWCYDPSGSPVTSFGTNGRAVWDTVGIKNNSLGQDEGHDLAIDYSGRIVVAGYASSGKNSYLAVWRLAGDTGAFDSAFSSLLAKDKGMVAYNNLAGSGVIQDRADAVAVDSKGYIYVTGRSNAGSTGIDLDMVLLKLSEVDGSKVTSFGSSGVVVAKGSPVAGGNDDDQGTGVAVKGSSVFVSGWLNNSYSSGGTMIPRREGVVWKFSAVDGSPDQNFGSAGVASVGTASDADLYDVIVDANDRVLACGMNQATLAVWRFSADGVLDSGFGNAGLGLDGDRGTSDLGPEALALDADGRIYTTGTVYPNDIARYDMFLIRLNP